MVLRIAHCYTVLPSYFLLKYTGWGGHRSISVHVWQEKLKQRSFHRFGYARLHGCTFGILQVQIWGVIFRIFLPPEFVVMHIIHRTQLVKSIFTCVVGMQRFPASLRYLQLYIFLRGLYPSAIMKSFLACLSTLLSSATSRGAAAIAWL